MEAHACSPDPFRVQFPGPFTHHEVVVDGWSVPFLKASLRGESEVRVLLDDRMAIETNAAEAERWLPFLADAIAVALGYGAHPRGDGPELPPKLPHRGPRRVVQVKSIAD